MTPQRKRPARRRAETKDNHHDRKTSGAETLGITFSTVDSVTDTNPRRIEESLDDFLKRFDDPVERSKKGGQLYIGGVFSDSGRRRDIDLVAATALVIDIDSGNVSAKEIESKLSRTRYVAHTTHNSKPGSLRWRIIIPYAHPATIDEHRTIWQRYAQRFPTDQSGRPPSHPFFWPSVPPGGHEHYIRLHNETGRLVDPKKQLISVDFTGVRLTGKPEEIGAGDGRNATLHKRLGEKDALRCESEHELLNLALDYNARFPAPLGNHEVRSVVRSKWAFFQTPSGIHRRASAVVKAPASGTWTPATKLDAEFEAWAIHRVIPLAGRVGVYGPPGEAKTAWLIALLAHLALDRPWSGCEIDQQMNVAYVATENPISVKRRVRAWARAHEVPYEHLDRHFFVFDGSLDLSSPSSVEAFKATIPILAHLTKGDMPVAWALDTIATAMSGDENTKDIQDAVQTIYRTIADAIGREPLLILVHHTGKDESREERGHSSLRAVLDAAIKLEAGDATGAHPSEHEPSTLIKQGVATVKKQRDGIDGQKFAFELHAIFMGNDDRGRPRSQVVALKSDDLAGAEAAAAAKRSKRSNKRTIPQVIREKFEELESASQTVLQSELLAEVARELQRNPEDMRAHFPRDIERAGLKSAQARPGVPSIVTRA